MSMVKIPGENVGNIKLYALSTCGWCQKTRKFLDDIGVAYEFEYVDQLNDEERDKAVQEITTWNPSRSFPTIVINNEKCIVGYNVDEIRKAVGK